MDNYGDLLYPVIIQKLAAKHGLAAAIQPLGIFDEPSPRASGLTVRGINKVLGQTRPAISGLIIGGGDVLRTDVARLAGHYYDNFKTRAASQFVFRLREKHQGRQHLETELVRRFMGYSRVAPFILDGTDHPQVGPVGYFSCGVPFRFPPENSPAIRRAFEAAAFVHVRDFQSRDKLREIGVGRDIEVSPDAIVTLGDFFDQETERLKGAAILARHGIAADRSVVCVQSFPQSPTDADELLQALTALKQRLDVEIVLLPLGYCHGDAAFLQSLAQKSNGQLTCVGLESVYEMISVIAASQLFVGTSMHGNITAFSFGIPHLFGPIAVDKMDGFLDVVGLGADSKLESWSQLDEKQRRLAQLPADHFVIKAQAAKQRVHQAFGKVAEVFKAALTP